ncbi:hypothetical protein QE152_g8572 [Popillia japonica]|uniref:Uncharacterized protein n=1 Tax=Popillia japonica TaxID=7064 RepID=A0AAW1M2A4_POPJA
MAVSIFRRLKYEQSRANVVLDGPVNEILDLKALSTAPVATISEDAFEDLIQEIHERESRKCNLIMYGVTEVNIGTADNGGDRNVVATVLDKVSITDAYSYYVNDAQNNISANPYRFWSFVRDKRQKSRIPGRMVLDGESLDDPRMIVNGFGRYFGSVFTQPSFAPNHQNHYNVNTCLNITEFSVDEIVKSIIRLKDCCSSGRDQISVFFIKDCNRVLAYPLAKLFKLALSTSSFSDVWKMARIVPIFKSDDSCDITNYRPIAILSNIPVT